MKHRVYAEDTYQNGLLRAAALVLSLIGSIALVYFGTLAMGYRFLEKYPPDGSIGDWIRAAGCVTIALLFLLSLRPPKDQARPFIGSQRDLWPFYLLYGLSGFILACAAIVAAIEPAFLFQLTHEFSVSELVSETLLAASAVLALTAARWPQSHNAGLFGPLRASLVFGAISALAFLILMEEISWGQKFLQWSTPGFLDANAQNETNFHNFYTNRFELAYYSAAVFAFVVLPFSWPRDPVATLRPLSFYVPPPAFAIIGAPLCTYMFTMWNIIPLQICFYLCLFILAGFSAARSSASSQFGILSALMAGGIIAAQMIFLLQGQEFERRHDLTEIRELQIALMIFAYTGWLALEVRRGGDKLEPKSV